LAIDLAVTGRQSSLSLRQATLRALEAIRVAGDDRLLPWPREAAGELVAWFRKLMELVAATENAAEAKGGAA
jgi:hypothetical protein